jgi:hypothetical protein
MPTNRPAIPAEIKRAIFVEAGHRCACCGTSFPLERAHIVPWRESHNNSAENLLCLCANCHEMADRNWDRSTFYDYKQRPWVNRQYQQQDPGSQKTHSSGHPTSMDALPPRPLNSAKEAMLACFAHLRIEHERWGLDATDADSLRCLQEMKSITWKDASGEEITRDILATEREEWLQDFRTRIAVHLGMGVARADLGRRMDRIYSFFTMFGYNQHYAGFEAFLRERIYKLLRLEEFVTPPLGMPGWRQRFEAVADDIWNDPKIQIEAAVYMAYTDYHEHLSRRFLYSIETAPNPPMQPTGSSSG